MKIIEKIIQKIRGIIRERKCRSQGHQWIEWTRLGVDVDYPRRDFFIGKTLLKNPYCGRCLEDKFKTKKEEYAYRNELRDQGML